MRIALSYLAGLALIPSAFSQVPQCIDNFCIGQTIDHEAFYRTQWLTPNEHTSVKCERDWCKKENLFRGYPTSEQEQLSKATSLQHGGYTLIYSESLKALNKYTYECNNKQRKFFGVYRSSPTGHISVVGLRLVNGRLTVYRLSRNFQVQNSAEFKQLSKTIKNEYDGKIAFRMDVHSSNMYSDAISGGLDGWLAPNTNYRAAEPFNNTFELVLIDPRTRGHLTAASRLSAGDIIEVPTQLDQRCLKSIQLR